MPTKAELERKLNHTQKNVLLFFLIIVVCLVMITWLTTENMMIKSDDSNCFHSFDLSYECNSYGHQLMPAIRDGSKYWICGDLYEIRAC